jgi:hypothetical protein
VTIKTEEPTLKIPIGDWMKEFVREEVDVSSEEKIIELATKEKMPTSQIARLVIVAREAGYAPDEIIPPNKLILNAGASASIQQIIATRYRELEIANNKTVKVREFVAPVREVMTRTEEPEEVELSTEQVIGEPETQPQQQPTEPGFVNVQTDEACQRAIDYLLGRIPGYVYSRLAIVAVNGGEVVQVAERLKAEIDRVVRELT